MKSVIKVLMMMGLAVMAINLFAMQPRGSSMDSLGKVPSDLQRSFEVKSDGESVVPEFLYKILSQELWERSMNRDTICLPDNDIQDKFIHLSKQDQVASRLQKLSDKNPVAKLLVFKISTENLKILGDLKLEPADSGELFYHLYAQDIPTNMVTLDYFFGA